MCTSVLQKEMKSAALTGMCQLSRRARSPALIFYPVILSVLHILCATLIVFLSYLSLLEYQDAIWTASEKRVKDAFM